MVDNYAAFFNYTPMGRASDFIMPFTLIGWGRRFLSVAWSTGAQLSGLTDLCLWFCVCFYSLVKFWYLSGRAPVGKIAARSAYDTFSYFS